MNIVLTDLTDLLIILAVLLAVYGLFRMRWIIIEGVMKPTKWVSNLLAKAILGIARDYQSIWKWICGIAATDTIPSDSQPTIVKNDANKYPLDKVFSGIVGFLLVLVACGTNYWALKLAWEIVFPGMERALGSIDFTAISSLTMLMGIVMAGALWRDAEHFVDADKVANATKIGFWGLMFLVAISIFLAMLRALIIAKLNLAVAVITGIATGVIDLVVAVAFSIAFRNFLYPLGQRIIAGIETGIEKRISIVGTVIKFIVGLVFWVVLTILIVPLTVICLPFLLPEFLLKLKKLYEKRRGEDRADKAKQELERVKHNSEVQGEIEHQKLATIENQGEIKRTKVEEKCKMKELRRQVKEALRLGIKLSELQRREDDSSNGRNHGSSHQGSNMESIPDELKAPYPIAINRGGDIDA